MPRDFEWKGRPGGYFFADFMDIGGRHCRGRIKKPDFARLKALPHNSSYKRGLYRIGAFSGEGNRGNGVITINSRGANDGPNFSGRR